MKKSKVYNFMWFLQQNDVIKLDNDTWEDGVCVEETYVPADGVSLHFKDREVLQICACYNTKGEFKSAMVIALDGIEHFLEETITARNLKKFEAFRKFDLPV